MRRYILLSAAIVLFFLVLPAAAQEGPWRVFYTNSSGDQFYYDADNLTFRDTDSIARATVKASTAKEGAGPRELTMTVEINCAKELYRKVEWQAPGPEASVRTVKNPTEWNYIPQRSHIEILKDIACKNYRGRHRAR